MVHINMLEGVPGVFTLFCAIEDQSHQVPVTTDNLTGVNAAHNLQRQDTQAYYHKTDAINEG